MKTNLYKIGIAIGSILIFLSVLNLALPNNPVSQTLGGIRSKTYCYNRDSAASSSVTYLVPTATSTSVVCNISRNDVFSWDFLYTASTTSSVLVMEPEFSHDQGTWFNQASLSTSGRTITVSATTTYQFAPVAVGTTSGKIIFTDVPAGYIRFNYKSTSTPGAIWWVLTRSDFNN